MDDTINRYMFISECKCYRTPLPRISLLACWNPNIAMGNVNKNKMFKFNPYSHTWGVVGCFPETLRCRKPWLSQLLVVLQKRLCLPFGIIKHGWESAIETIEVFSKGSQSINEDVPWPRLIDLIGGPARGVYFFLSWNASMALAVERCTGS